jgi:hypothetical protein
MASGPVRFLIGMLVCYLPSIPASAQQSSVAINPPSTHVTVQLRALGIGLSERSLIEALSNSDSNVRVLAALQLGQDRDVRSIPSIEYALSIEPTFQAMRAHSHGHMRFSSSGPPNRARSDYRLSPVVRLPPAGAFEPSTTIRPEPDIEKYLGLDSLGLLRQVLRRRKGSWRR